MKYRELRKIIVEEAGRLKDAAAFNGLPGDGGYDSLISKLEKFELELIRKNDLIPSEYYKLYNIEIGEPFIFKSEIKDYKTKLANKFKL